jgi:hypothetical protein
LTAIPDGFNPTVGGSLYLSSLTAIPDGFNPTVGGYLDLSSLTAIPDGFNPTVVGSLDLRSSIEVKAKVIQWPLVWPDGKHIMADGILQELLGKKGNVYHVKGIGERGISYLVTDGSGKFSHGATLKEARKSLIYKIGDRDTSRYSNIAKTKSMSLSEIIECYRIITGACEAGTRNFVERLGERKKDTYTIKEAIELTEGEYGNEKFRAFFDK